MRWRCGQITLNASKKEKKNRIILAVDFDQHSYKNQNNIFKIYIFNIIIISFNKNKYII